MKLTKKQILDLKPCCEGLQFAKSCRFNAVRIWNTCERGDWLIWLLQHTRVLTKPQAVSIAIECAAHVLDRFDLQHPDDKRPRAAIVAARKWLAYPSEENRAAAAAARTAAAAAAAAARAAAYTAATAAAAAAYAAAAAAAAARAAARDAADAAAYAAANQSSERKWQAGKIRELIPCPFA